MARSRVSMMKVGALPPKGSAEQLVRTVGARLGMDDNEHYSQLMDTICENMKNELVLEEWQLSALDSFQWKNLGAPIGLAAAVRTLASAAGACNITTTTTSSTSVMAAMTGVGEALPSMISTSSALAETTPAGAPIPTRNKSQSVSSQIMKSRSLASSIRSSSGVSPIVEEEDEDDPVAVGSSSEGGDEESAISSKQQQRQDGKLDSSQEKSGDDNGGKKKKKKQCKWTCAGRPSCVMTLSKSLSTYEKGKGIFRTVFTGRSFPMTSRFQQALIHSKSGADLKAHTVFVMELNVLAAALFFGAGVELWGSFPDSYVSDPPEDPTEPYVPRNLALTYHFISCANLIIQLVCTSGWIWSIHATAAVSPNKFHEFFVQARYAMDNFLFFSEFGQVMLVLNITLLLGAQISATTGDPVIRNIGYYLPIVLLFIGCKFVHTLSSYVGRVAYHGLLLMDDDPDDIGISSENDFTVNKDGSAIKAEQETIRNFHQHNVTCEESVLDIYRKATAPRNDDEVPMSMLDVIFPMSKNPKEVTDMDKED